MKKILLALLVGFIAANFAVSEAAQVPIYDSDARDLYNDIKNELEITPNANCLVKNFKRFSSGDDKSAGLKFWVCDLLRKNSREAEAKIIFAVNSDSEVNHLIICCDGADADNEEIGSMMLITSLGCLEVLDLEEAELNSIFNDIINQPHNGAWGVWKDDVYYKLEFGKEDGVAGFVITAFTRD